MVTFWSLHSPSQNDQYYFEALGKALDSYSRALMKRCQFEKNYLEKLTDKSLKVYERQINLS